MEAQPSSSYESYLNQYLYSGNTEKSFVDKVLNRKDSERLQKLMKKDDLTRNDLLEILYIISGTNVKLVNYNDWDRYLLGKDFAWIRDFATLCESVIEWNNEVKKEIEEIEELKDEEDNKVKNELSELLDKIKALDLHNFKFLVDVYLNLSNSTLSLRGVGFDTLTKSRFEYFYPPESSNTPQPEGRNILLRNR